MARAKYQVLVIPYLLAKDGLRYCVFRRRDLDIWQFIAGGGEDFDRSPADAARRETREESGVDAPAAAFHELDTICSISTEHFGAAAREAWGGDCFVIPEHSFAVEFSGAQVELSDEHTECRWLSFRDAGEILRFDSNKTALWELDSKLKRGLI